MEKGEIFRVRYFDDWFNSLIFNFCFFWEFILLIRCLWLLVSSLVRQLWSVEIILSVRGNFDKRFEIAVKTWNLFHVGKKRGRGRKCNIFDLYRNSLNYLITWQWGYLLWYILVKFRQKLQQSFWCKRFLPFFFRCSFEFSGF